MNTKTVQFAAVIGMDWSDQKHDLCLYDCSNQTVESSVIGAQPEAILAWVERLHHRFRGRPIAICLEQKRGPLIYALCQYDFLVLFPVNPQTVANYRQAFTPSRAKDDPSDAQILLDLLLKHRDKFQAWYPASVELRQLQQFVQWRRTLVAEGVRVTNRLVDVLKGYFPQVLDCFEHRDTLIFCDFLTQWLTLQDAQAATDETLQAFFTHHNSRYKACNARRIARLRQGIPLTQDSAIIEPSLKMVKALVGQLRSLIESLPNLKPTLPTCLSNYRMLAYLMPYLEPAPTWLLACCWPLVKTALVTPVPKTCCSMPGLLR